MVYGYEIGVYSNTFTLESEYKVPPSTALTSLNSFFLIFLISINCLAQYDYRDSNRIGISFGINQFDLNTNDFQTKPGTGWNGGLSMRGNYYNNWDMVYVIQFSENNFSEIKSKSVVNGATCLM